MTKSHLPKNKTIYVIASMAVLLISVGISLMAEEQCLQIRAIGLLISSLILWLSEAIPMSIATLAFVFLMPFLGLMNFDDIIKNFGLNTSLFIMASSGITVAIAKSNIPNNIAAFVFRKTQNHPCVLIFVLGMAITLFSGFVSNLATCTLFYSLVSTALKKADIKAGKSNFGKALMLMIPACAGIGGFVSPAGTPSNLLVIEMLEQNGVYVSFSEWCMIGLPVSLLTAVIFLSFLVLFIRPEKPENIANIESHKFGKKDWVITATTVIVVIGWFLSSYIPSIDITTIAIFGLAFLFIPSFKVLNMENFSSGVNWDLVFTMGSVSVLMIGISNTGVMSQLISKVFYSITSYPLLIVLFIVSISICIIRAFIPTSTAVIALLAPILASVSEITGISFTPLILIASVWASTPLLLIYTEPLYLISYKERFYGQKDLLKVGTIPCILCATLCTALIYYLSIAIL